MKHFRTGKDWSMGRAEQTPIFSAADYLAWEAAQPERHEYIDGGVFAMAGAEDRHVTVTMNLGFALRRHLSGIACRTYMSDMRLQVAAANSYFYPDVRVYLQRAGSGQRHGQDGAQAHRESALANDCGPRPWAEVRSLPRTAQPRGIPGGRSG